MLADFLSFVKTSATENVKIEFQGGEPTLRLDLVTKVVKAVSSLKSNPSFVICTNLSKISDELKNLLKRDDFSISSY